MEVKILLLYLGLGVLLYALALYPKSRLSKLAYSRFGPIGYGGEYYSGYLLRWAVYSIQWLAQIVVIWLLFALMTVFFPRFEESQLFLLFAAFALPIGAFMAVLSSIGFLVRFLKAKYVGPNPQCLG